MRSKAIERLQRIHELFPHEEERNQELRKLYISAGIQPKYARSVTTEAAATASGDQAGLAAAATATASGDQAGLAAAAAAASEAADVSSLAKVAEITRTVNRPWNA